MKLKLLTILFVSFVLLAAVSAHERHVYTIGDKNYIFVVGSLNEPISVDDKTGVDLRISRADPNNLFDFQSTKIQPVEGLENSLKVELIAGDKKKTLALEPKWRDPGAYQAPFYPTVATTYKYRIIGEINTIPVDITFSCNPGDHSTAEEDKSEVIISENVKRIFKTGSYGCPHSRDEIYFPEKAESLLELTNENAKIKSQVTKYTMLTFFTLAIVLIFMLLILFKKK